MYTYLGEVYAYLSVDTIEPEEMGLDTEMTHRATGNQLHECKYNGEYLDAVWNYSGPLAACEWSCSNSAAWDSRRGGGPEEGWPGEQGPREDGSSMGRGAKRTGAAIGTIE